MRRLFTFIFCFFVVLSVCGLSRAQQEAVEVINFEGDVKVIPKGATNEVNAEKGMMLKTGDRIKTGEASFVEIGFDPKAENIMRIDEATFVLIKLEGEEKIELIDGKVFTVLNNVQKGDVFRIKTPTAVCGARGTAWEVSTDGWVTSVAVVDDKVFVQGVNQDGTPMEKVFWVKKGFLRYIKKFENPGKLTKLTPEEFQRLLDMLKKYIIKELPNGIRDKLDKKDDDAYWGKIERKDQERVPERCRYKPQEVFEKK